MAKPALIITDNIKGRWLNKVGVTIPYDLPQISVLTLGINPDHFIESNRRRDFIRNNVEFLDISDISEQVQNSVREFYINFIFELPQKTKENLFLCNGKNLWWYLELTEKAQFPGKIICRLFYLGLIRFILEKQKFDQVYIDIDDSCLARALLEWDPVRIKKLRIGLIRRLQGYFSLSSLCFISRYLKHSFGLVFLCLIRSVIIAVSRIGGSKGECKDALFFYTSYPSWWHDPYGGKAGENFFGSLPQELMQNHRVCYITSLFSLNPLTVIAKKGYFKDFFNKNRMIFLEESLRFRDKFQILSGKYLWWALNVRKHFQRSHNCVYNGFRIDRMVLYEISNSLSHIEFFKSILMEDALDKFVKRYRPSALIYRIEFNIFEKAILSGIRKRCRTIGLQHSTLSRNLISHFFAPGEIIFHLSKGNSLAAMPLPDNIFTAGSYFRDIMVKAGFPAENIDICGPIRYRRLLSFLKEEKDGKELRKALGFSDSERVFLVAMNWVEREGMAMIASLIAAIPNMDKPVRVIIRSHPHKNYDHKMRAFLKNAKSRLNFSFFNDKFSIYEGIRAADGFIQVPSSLGYEAMAIGKMPILYQNRHIFNVNSLEELEGRAPIACSAQGLRDAMLLVVNDREKTEAMRNRWPETVEKFFYDIRQDPKERFIGLLKKHGILN